MSLSLFFLFVSLVAVSFARIHEIRHPVIIIPGDGGNQLWAKLNKTTSPHPYCQKTTKDYFNLWLNLEELMPPAIYCFIDNIRLHYNNKTHITSNTRGVDIKVPGFGETKTLEWLDPSEIALSWYMSPIVRSLVSWGYQRGKSVRGAPYDFRKAANEIGSFYTMLELLIRETFILNGNKKIVLLAHSFGNFHALYFLQRQPKAWKDKYIESFINMAAPLAGSLNAIRAMTSGDRMHIYTASTSLIRAQQRSMTSTAWMLPSRVFWSKTESLVLTPKRNYTAWNYELLFKDIGFREGYLKYEDTEPLLRNLSAPGVKVYCMHGYGIQTPAKLQFSKIPWQNEQPKVKHADGDGTVSLRSLEACKNWNRQQAEKVFHVTFEGAGHSSILSDTRVLKYLKNILFFKP